jgi:hypothetical protein
MRDVAHACITFASELNGFEAEIRRVIDRKITGKSKTVGIGENPLVLHMWRIRAPVCARNQAFCGRNRTVLRPESAGRIALGGGNRRRVMHLGRAHTRSHDATEVRHGGASASDREFATMIKKSRSFANIPKLTASDRPRSDRLSSPRRGIRI